MKQLLKEVQNVSTWCFSCPFTKWKYMDGNGEVIKEESDIDEKQFKNMMEKASILAGGPVVIIDSKTNTVLNGTVSEEIPGQDVQQVFDKWRQSYDKLSNCRYRMSCPYIIDNGLEIHVDRDFVIPQSNNEVLRILDQLHEYFEGECDYNKMSGSLSHTLKIAIAKIDFTLLEEGRDMMVDITNQFGYLYQRQRDISLCGFSKHLIDKYFCATKRTPSSEKTDRVTSYDQQASNDCSGNADSLSTSPLITGLLKDYLDALAAEGYLDQNYKWIKVRSHTNYHAGLAAKIIIANVPGVIYAHLTDIIGVKHLADAASTCIKDNKSQKISDITKCFEKHGLNSSYI